MRFFYLILLISFNFSSFAQWRSYYPEGKASKKEQQKISDEKNKQIFVSDLFNALKAKSLEDYDEALRYFDKCQKTDPTHPLPFYESAIINAGNGSFDIATEQIKNAVKLDPENNWYLLLYAQILFNKQDFINSAIQYKKLISADPRNEDFYFRLAEAYIYANQIRKAIITYNDLEKYKGINKMLSMQKQSLYRELNDIRGAIKELKALLNKFPDDVEAMEILAELYLLNNEKEKAFKLFEEISVINPDNGRLYLTLADYYREIGDEEKSYDNLKLAFNSKTLNIDAKIRVLLSYYELIGLGAKIRDQAYELAEILIKTHPEDLKSRAVFADILYIDNQYLKAKEQYLIILQTDKSKNEIWNQVLFIQAEENDFEGMLKTSQEALEYFPADPLFYYFNGFANRQFENYEKAITSLETGIEFVIENQKLLLEFYSSLADIYHTKKQHNLSDNYYEKALSIDSNNILVLNNYAYYLALRKSNLERAKKLSFRCNLLEPENGTYQDTYAWVLYALKEYKMAEKWLLKSLLNGGDQSPVIVEHYGDVLYKLGDRKNALKQWKKAKSLGVASEFLNQKIQEGKLYE